jgi:hypothetical protein
MEIALAAEHDLIARRMDIEACLETLSTSASGVPLSRYASDVADVVRYALRCDCDDPAAAVDKARGILADMVSCPTAKVHPSETATLERIDPYLSDLVTCCAAALGRYRLEVEEAPIPDTWLAALASVTQATIRSYVSEHRAWTVPLKRPRGERWRVTVASAKKFLAQRAEQDAR